MAKKVKARVLVDCALGKADDVVEIDERVAAAHAQAGEVDVHPDAVAYALGLPQNQREPTQSSGTPDSQS